MAFWLFFLHRTANPLAPWARVLEVIERLRVDGTLCYLPDCLPGLNGPEIPVSHKIVLRTVPKSGELIGYFEVLRTLKVGGIVAQGSGSLLEHIYVADVFGKAERTAEFSIDAGTSETTDWNVLGIGRSKDDILAYIERAQAPLQQRWESRLNQFPA